jgi:hypothetical protein
VIDLNEDGLNDLVMLDHEGYLAWFERRRQGRRLVLLPGRHVFEGEEISAFDNRQNPKNKTSGPLQLNTGRAGKSGRRKLCLTDWDRDGQIDLLVNSRNVNLLRWTARNDGQYIFRDTGPMDTRVLAGHTTSPTVVDWDRNQIPDLLVGGEDGHLYYMKNPLGAR